MRDFLAFVLMAFMILQFEAFAQEVQRQTQPTPQHQDVPKPEEQPKVYVPGLQPFIWDNPGREPYWPGGGPNRDDLMALSKKSGLLDDLLRIYTQPQAFYIIDTLSRVTEPGSIITEIELPRGMHMIHMMLNAGKIIPMVILAADLPKFSGFGNTWQMILPSDLGSLVIWLPKICLNICQAIIPAQPRIEPIIKTEIREISVEKIVEKPVFIDKPFIVEKKVIEPVYIEKPVIVEREKIVEVPKEIIREVPVQPSAADLKKAIDIAILKIPKGGDIYQDNRKYEIKISKSIPWWILPIILGASGVAAALALRDGPKKTYPREGVISPP